MNILALNTRSIFQHFENYLRTEVHMVEDDIKVFLNEYKSSFITYEIQPGIYSLRDLSQDLLNIL